MTQTISKSKFKPRMLQYFREVEETEEEIIITDRGKPVLKISPYKEEESNPLAALRNTVIEYQSPLEPVGENDWELLK